MARFSWVLVALIATQTLAPAPIAHAADCTSGARILAGITFERLCANVVDVLIDAQIEPGDAAALRAQVVDDAAAVQAEFGLDFPSRPVIHVVATTARYAAALHVLFGYPDVTARWVADNSVAFFEPATGGIAVDWDAIRDRRPITAIRHELTHLITLSACAPRCDLVPAWLNEGQAHFAEAAAPGAAWRALRMRYEAASLVTTGTFMPLTVLVTQQSWNAITSWQGYYKYQEAARVTELLRDDVGGERPIATLYQRLRGGENVARAYRALSGKDFAEFVSALPARLQEGADGPGIETVGGTPEGPGTSFVLYGFAPESEVTLSIDGRFYTSHQVVTVSPEGSWFGWLGDAAPSGVYRLTTATGAWCASVVVAKRGGRRAILDPDAVIGDPARDPCAPRPRFRPN